MYGTELANYFTTLIEPIPDIYLPVIGIGGALFLTFIVLTFQTIVGLKPDLKTTGQYSEETKAE